MELKNRMDLQVKIAHSIADVVLKIKDNENKLFHLSDLDKQISTHGLLIYQEAIKVMDIIEKEGIAK